MDGASIDMELSVAMFASSSEESKSSGGVSAIGATVSETSGTPEKICSLKGVGVTCSGRGILVSTGLRA